MNTNQQQQPDWADELVKQLFSEDYATGKIPQFKEAAALIRDELEKHKAADDKTWREALDMGARNEEQLSNQLAALETICAKQKVALEMLRDSKAGDDPQPLIDRCEAALVLTPDSVTDQLKQAQQQLAHLHHTINESCQAMAGESHSETIKRTITNLTQTIRDLKDQRNTDQSSEVRMLAAKDAELNEIWAKFADQGVALNKAIVAKEAAEAKLAGAKAELHRVRPLADCYERVCQSLGIKNEILGFVDQLRAELKAAQDELIEAKENHARDVCHTREVDRDYMGQVAGTRVTDSGAISTNALLLEDLAAVGRFRIVSKYGRMVVGYWPENDPARKSP